MLQTPGFNLNGIVAENGVLLVASSTTGKLFRVDPATGVADEFDLGGADLGYPDGLELLGHTLYVVRPFENRVTVVSLGARLRRGVVLGDLTDPSFGHPIDRDRGRGPAVGGQPAVSRRRPSRPRATGSHELPLRPEDATGHANREERRNAKEHSNAIHP